jgi:hypothetical protein
MSAILHSKKGTQQGSYTEYIANFHWPVSIISSIIVARHRIIYKDALVVCNDDAFGERNNDAFRYVCNNAFEDHCISVMIL